MTPGRDHTRPPGVPEHAHQPEDTRVRTVTITLAVILVSVVVIYSLIAVIGALLDRRAAVVPTDTDLLSVRRLAAEPSPLDTLATLRARLAEEQQGRLRRTEWIDRGAGIARIPIDDAIAIIAARGSKPGGGP